VTAPKRKLIEVALPLEAKRGWAQQALLFNSLGTSWSDLSTASRKVPSMAQGDGQGAFDYDDEG
jgi:putative DNA methylase